MGSPGKLVVAIPTGYGTNGVRKEALTMLLNLVTEMSIDGIVNKKWGSYYLLDDEYSIYSSRKKWGMIITTEVEDLEKSKYIVQDFGFDLGDHPQYKDIKSHIVIKNPFTVKVIDEP